MTTDLATDLATDLRSLDWRHLLPAPAGERFRRLVILGGTPEQAALALESGLADSVSLYLGGAAADAVIVLDGAMPEVADVARAVVDDGVLYWAVDRRARGQRLRTPGRLRRALRQHGLVASATYLLTPDARSPHMYLPLDAPGPLSWFLRTLFLMDTPMKRCAGWTLGQLAGSAAGLRAIESLAPGFCVVASRGGRKGDEKPAPSLLHSSPVPDRLRVGDAQALLLAWGRNESNRLAMMPFAPGSEGPSHVLKIARSARHGAGTMDEQRALGDLDSRLVGPLRDTVPRPLGAFEWQGVPVGAESCVSGQLLACALGEWGASFVDQARSFERAAGWLTRFHGELRLGEIVWDEAAIDRFVDAPLSRYEATLGQAAGEAELFAAARAAARAMSGQSVPEVWQHAGFGAVNMFVDDAAVRVIDWECSAPGLPLLDLLNFAVEWGHGVRRIEDPELRALDLDELFMTPGSGDERAAVIARAIARYVGALRLAPEFVSLAPVLLHVTRALGYVDRSGRQPGIREENVHARYVEALARRHERLFR